MIPSKCILIYKTQHLTESINYYCEVGTFNDKGNILEYRPLSIEEKNKLKKIFESDLALEHSISRYVFKNIVYQDDTIIAWKPDNYPKELSYIIGSQEFKKRINLPKILFILRDYEKLSIYFYEEDNGINSILYKANLPNVNTSVCLGRNKIVGKSINEILNSAENLFFYTPFTNEIKNIRKWRKEKIQIKKLF